RQDRGDVRRRRNARGHRGRHPRSVRIRAVTKAATGSVGGASSAPPTDPTHAAATRRARGSRRNWRKGAEIFFFVSPALALFGLFVVVPVLTAVQMSVYRWRGFGPLEDFVGFRNYVSVLTNDVFQGAVGHTMT